MRTPDRLPSRDDLPSRDELEDAQLVLLRVLQWLHGYPMTSSEYTGLNRHLRAEAHSIDLARAERFLDALGKVIRPDADEAEFEEWMRAEFDEL